MTAARTLLLAALLLATACRENPRATPREALEALRDAIAAGDGVAFYGLLDTESAALGRAQVRERRALLERGDDPAQVLKGLGLSADEFKSGREEDVAAKFFPLHSPLFKSAKWVASATVAQERSESPVSTWIDLRGEDGTDRGLWFVLERGRWCFDQVRTRREW